MVDHVVTSDTNIPQIPNNPLDKFFSTYDIHNDIHKQNNIINSIHNEVTAYCYVSLIFIVVLVIFIGVMINDINCKILNLYYNTKKYNDHIIMKMFII